MLADLPGDLEPHANIFITGVESEEVEEVNDAYADIMEELGEELAGLFKSLTQDYLSQVTPRNLRRILKNSCLPASLF